MKTDNNSARRIHVLSKHIAADEAGVTYNVAKASQTQDAKTPAPAVVVGAMIMDVQGSPEKGRTLHHGTSVPGHVEQVPGGVGRNVAQSLAVLRPPGCPPPLLISAVGLDPAGDALLAHWSSLNLSTEGVRRCPGLPTPSLLALFDEKGDLQQMIADTKMVDQGLSLQWIDKFQQQIRDAPLVVVEGNLPAAILDRVCRISAAAQVPVWFEPVSVAKAVKAIPVLPFLSYISPNADELYALQAELSPGGINHVRGGETTHIQITKGGVDVGSGLLEATECLIRAGVDNVVLTVGEQGSVLSQKVDSTHGISSEDSKSVKCTHCHVGAITAKVVNVSGAGDSLVAGVCAGLLAGTDNEGALRIGTAAASRAVQSNTNSPQNATYADLLLDMQQASVTKIR